MKRIMLTCILFQVIFFSKAQNEEIDLETFAERLFQSQDENVSYEDIYESLLLYYTHKLNLNKAEPEELSSLYLLSPLQLTNFFEHRDQFGALLSIHELQTIPSFTTETIRSLYPFVTVNETNTDPRPFFQRVLEEENSYLLLRYSRRLESQKAYEPSFPDTTFRRNENNAITDTLLSTPNRYNGSPAKIYGRLRVSRRQDFSIGFTFEKDAGEPFEFNEHQNGFDFYSYHLLLEKKWGFEKIILGDFQLQVGQGLVFGAGFNAGKGAETVNPIKRNNLGILPYTSVLESGFFRGVGLSRSFRKFNISLLYSQLNQDGNVTSDSTYSEFEEFANAIQQSGLHRTARELQSKNQIREQSVGGVLQYKLNRQLTAGITILKSSFSTPLQKKPNNYNQFEFKGDNNFIGSGYLNFNWQNFSFFGEVARSSSGGMSAVGGFVASLSPIIDMGFHIRKYDRDFHSFYGRALSESSRIINENGTYWGLSIHPSHQHRFNLYYDRFRFPWLRFRTEAPSEGHEYLARYTYRPKKALSMYVQVREQKRQLSKARNNLNVLADQIRRNYSFNIDYRLTNTVKLKTKVQSSTQQEDGTTSSGFAIIQDMSVKAWKLKVNARFALFDTDDFANRQYTYENDVLYAFSIPAYSGTGVRNYIMLRYDPARNISLWLRYARSTLRNLGPNPTVGSGLEAIRGNKVSEIKIMTRIKL